MSWAEVDWVQSGWHDELNHICSIDTLFQTREKSKADMAKY